MASEEPHPSPEQQLHHSTKAAAQLRTLPRHTLPPPPLPTPPLPTPPLPPPPPPPLTLEHPAGRSWFFNAAFAGPSRVGKSKLIQRFVDSQFRDSYVETTETAPQSKSISLGQHQVLFQCWDTPGVDTLIDGLDPRLKFLHTLFIIFDASRDTATELEHWCRLIDTCRPPRPLLILVGNKSDLGVYEEALSRARELSQIEKGMLFVLSVLADDENMEVDAMMLEVAKSLIERHSLSLVSMLSVGPFGEAASDANKRGKSELHNTQKSEGPISRLKEMLAVYCCQCC